MSIEGKVAVITGGTKGIGFGIAAALIEAGARVFICGRDKGDLKTAIDRLSQKGDAAGEICDVRSEDQVRMMFEECDRVFGGVDILVNSAGINDPKRNFFNVSTEAWDRILDALDNWFLVIPTLPLMVVLSRILNPSLGVLILVTTIHSSFGNLFDAIYGNTSAFAIDGPGIPPAPALGEVTLNSVRGTSCAHCTIEIFSDAGVQGRWYEGTITADATGAFHFTTQSVFRGPNITATATDTSGSTSVFSVALARPALGPRRRAVGH